MGVQVPPPAFVRILFLTSLLLVLSACAPSLSTQEYKRRLHHWRDLIGDTEETVQTSSGTIRLSTAPGDSLPTLSILHHNALFIISLEKTLPESSILSALRVSDSGDRLIILYTRHGFTGVRAIHLNGSVLYETFLDSVHDAQWGYNEHEFYYSTIKGTLTRVDIRTGDESEIINWGDSGYLLMKRQKEALHIFHTDKKISAKIDQSGQLNKTTGEQWQTASSKNCFDNSTQVFLKSTPRAHALQEKLLSLKLHEEIVSVPTEDGSFIPVTTISSGAKKSRGILVEVYGAYNTSLDTTFSVPRALLLEDGFLLYFAHVRGGSECGESWHAAGSGKNKLRGVLDLESVLQYAEQFKLPIFIKARSAGALLAAGALSRQRTKIHGAVFEAPFVNLDWWIRSGDFKKEREEFGDPQSAEFRALRHSLGTIPQPIFIWLGARDSTIPKDSVLEWATTFAPRAQIHLHESAGHEGPPTITEQDELAALEHQFIEALLTN